MEDRPEIFVYVTTIGEIVGPKMELVAKSMCNMFDVALPDWMTLERVPTMMQEGPHAGKMGVNMRATLHESPLYLKSGNVHAYHLADAETANIYYSTKTRASAAKSGIIAPDSDMPTTPSGIFLPS